MVKRTRILVIDDHPLIGEGLKISIGSRIRDCDIILCESVGSARAIFREHARFDAILLDFYLPDSYGLSGLYVMESLARETPIILLTASNSPSLAGMARLAGASGFISKLKPLGEIAQEVQKALQGWAIFPPHDDVQPGLVELHDRISSLSGAQIQVLAELVNGRANKQIAWDLGLTEGTIKAHLTAVFHKLCVKGRVEAVRAVMPLFGQQLAA